FGRDGSSCCRGDLHTSAEQLGSTRERKAIQLVREQPYTHAPADDHKPDVQHALPFLRMRVHEISYSPRYPRPANRGQSETVSRRSVRPRIPTNAELQ